MQKKLRICLISREYPPDTGWGGIGAYTYQHANALRRLGHEVEIISLAKADVVANSSSSLKNPEETNIQIDTKYIDDTKNSINSINSNLEDPIVYRAIWGNLFKELSTIWISLPYSHFVLKSCFALWQQFLQVHNLKPFDIVEAPEHLAEALFIALTKKCPLVLRLHTPHFKFIQERYHNLSPTFDHRLVSILERFCILEANLLSSPSKDLANFVARDIGIEADSISFVPNPVDTKKFHPEGNKAIINGTNATVFFAGRLEERKGVHVLIEAIPKILKLHPNTKFILVGADTNTGPGKTSVLAILKENLKESLSLEAVSFINHVDLNSMPDYYRSADICVVPSLYENAPYTVLEAQASAKPVITTSAGGSKEYIQDGVTGFVVPAKDSQALADKINLLLSDPELIITMGIEARKRILQNFDTTIVAKEALESYAKAIENYSSNRNRALYCKAGKDSLEDFISLLYSYHNNLCELLYRHSFQFRLKYWSKLACRRPKLCIAKIILAILKRFDKKIIFLPKKIKLLMQKLEKDVMEKENEKERLILDHLMHSCIK